MDLLPGFRKSDFGEDFIWGVSASAYQTEGAHNKDGKGPSIWDEFTRRGYAWNKQTGNHACDFYHRFREDLNLMQKMNIRNFRFSISWSRILPEGTGKINQSGIDFYNQLINECLSRNIEPWITLYHWDLPLALEKKGGWTNREVIFWFSQYTELCARSFGDRVKKWMVLNEPVVFTGAGYFMGAHAPGKRGIGSFLKALHHAVLVQGIIPSLIRNNVRNAEIGTTFSCSHLESYSNKEKDILATSRADVLLNRLFAEPAMGHEYPVEDFPTLKRVYDVMQQEDEKNMLGEYDFIGIQNYTREIITSAWYIPYLRAKIIPANKRKVVYTQMNWEVYPEAIYEVLMKFSKYKNIKKIYVTENGAAFPDVVTGNSVHDENRLQFLQSYMKQVLRAKNEGAKVSGYFVWSFTDNFEWAEGFRPRFGLVHVDFHTQKRIIKDSGKWYAEFLNEQ